MELTGLARNRYGFWADANLPLPLPRGFMGLEDATLIPVARYERVWLDSDLQELDFADGQVEELLQANREQDRLSLGLAFRPIPQAVFHLAYERSHALRGALIAPVAEEGEDVRTVNSFVLGLSVGF